MNINYKAVEKGQPGVIGGGEKKYYASIVRGRPVPMRTIIEEIAELNVTNPAVVMATLESFLQLAGRYLLRGKQIDLGQLGTFSPSIHSHGEETPEEVDKFSIKRLKVNYRPSGLLQEKLNNAKFVKIGDYESGEQESPAEDAA